MRHFVFSLLLINIWLVSGQSITSAEYFFDSDPGVGGGTILAVNANSGQLTQTYSINVSGLTDGFHDLYIRTFNISSNWSLYDRSTFYISSINSGQNIINAEYFFNTDTGVGTGTDLDVDPETSTISQQFAIPTTGLSEGFHSLYIRTQVADGTWSLYDRQIIYIKDFNNVPSAVTDGEYFIDSDPGVGSGVPISITGSPQVINFDTTGLSNGDHLFCIRVQNTEGIWSFLDCGLFNIDNSLSNDDSLYDSVKLSPTPFKTELRIDYETSTVFQKIKVYDMIGKEVFTSSDNLRVLNLANLDGGTYILLLETENQKASYKIIKE